MARPDTSHAGELARAGLHQGDGTGAGQPRSPLKGTGKTDRSSRRGKRTAPARPIAPGKPAPARTSTAVLEKAASAAGTGGTVKRSARGAARRKRRTVVRVLAAVVAMAAVAALGVAVVSSGLLRSSGPQHTVTVPGTLLSYTQEPALAKGMGAQALRAEIMRKGNGEASHVVDAVYEDNAASGSKSGPLIVLFIGGNLAGSAGSFISSFTGMMPGAFDTSPGRLGGQAACVPGTAGRPAECAWADNDTFGLFASPTLSASALGAEMRAMRPLVEHPRKKG